eukprot:9665984-Prorocentrum_lima.AAC.1
MPRASYDESSAWLCGTARTARQRLRNWDAGARRPLGRHHHRFALTKSRRISIPHARTRTLLLGQRSAL